MELSFKNLPFVPEAGQVIYAESSYDEKINEYIQKNYEWLVKEFAKYGFSFCYMPLHIRETIRYALPNASEKEIEQRMSDLPSLLQYAVEQVEIKPSLFFGIDLPVTDEMGNVVLQYVEIEPRWYRSMAGTFDSLIREIKRIEEERHEQYKKVDRIIKAQIAIDEEIKRRERIADIENLEILRTAEKRYEGKIKKYDDDEDKCTCFKVKEEKEENAQNTDSYVRYSIPVDTGDRKFSISSSPADNDDLIKRLNKYIETKRYSYTDTADYKFDLESRKILEEINERIEALKNKGINTWILRGLIDEEVKPSRIQITKDYRVFMLDYSMEVKMSRLPKAVFILFLRHPEGIRFKELSSYYGELKSIYRSIHPKASNEDINRRINSITNPLDNSINEKCARIREAFVKVIDESIAQNYFVTGQRGEAKKITLDRSLIIWD